MNVFVYVYVSLYLQVHVLFSGKLNYMYAEVHVCIQMYMCVQCMDIHALHTCVYMYIKHTKNNTCTCTCTILSLSLSPPPPHPSHPPPFLSLSLSINKNLSFNI